MEPLLSAQAGECGFQQGNKRTPALKSNLQERSQEFWKRQGLKAGVPPFPEHAAAEPPLQAPTPGPRLRAAPSLLPARGGGEAGGAARAEGGTEGERQRKPQTFVLGLRVRVAAEQIRHVGHGGSAAPPPPRDDVTRSAARASRQQPGGGRS